MVRGPIVGDENVGPAVAVEIGDGDSQSRSWLFPDPGFHRDVFKRHPRLVFAGVPSAVAEQFARRWGKPGRGTVFRSAAGIVTARGGVVVDVVDNTQVEPTVAVVIEERRGRCPLEVDESGFPRHVGEAHASQVQQQFHAVHLGDEEVGLAVVVDVAHGDPHVPAREIEPRARCHVLEGVVRFLTVDFIGAGRMGTGVREQDQIG